MHQIPLTLALPSRPNLADGYSFRPGPVIASALPASVMYRSVSYHRRSQSIVLIGSSMRLSMIESPERMRTGIWICEEKVLYQRYKDRRGIGLKGRRMRSVRLVNGTLLALGNTSCSSR